MRIYDCCPYMNEALVASVKLAENSEWITETHLTEANRTFKNRPKPYTLPEHLQSLASHHRYDARRVFRRGLWDRPWGPWYLRRTSCHWFNEAMQRNAASAVINPKDDDIVILSDVDEILDSRCAEEIIAEVRTHQVITVPLYVTQHYFDLFSDTWPGPPRYTHRVFVMTGRYFREMGRTSDGLRKAGESGRLIDEVYCLPTYAGFHHSWIGDARQALYKLASYSHAPSDHTPRILDERGQVNETRVAQRLAAGRSLFESNRLIIREDVPPLRALSRLRSEVAPYCLRPARLGA